MNESPQAGKQLLDRRKKRRRSEWMQALTNILYIKIPITNILSYMNLDVDKLLAWMLKYLWWIFTTTFMMLSVVVMVAALGFVAVHFETFWERWPSYHEFFSFRTLGYMWLALGLVKVIHEFGHGLSCKAFGGEVHEMGLLFLVFSPCLYCNVSDAWTLPSKWKRIIISFAGIYVELIIAAIATFVWWYTPAHPFINNLSLGLMVVCSVSTVVFNANPLMRYDGYYILADWLEIPNLRDRSNRFLQRLVMDYCLGIEVQPEQYMALWRRIMFVFYAIVSYIYRWVITFSILYFMSNFLKPYKLGVVSGMLATAAGASMVGWPLYRLGKNLHKRGRVPDMKSVRVTISSFAVAAVVLAFFAVPLPGSRVKGLALVQVQPALVEKAVVHIPATLEQIRVKDGQQVQKDEVLAVFRSLEQENLLEEERTQREIYHKEFLVAGNLLAQGVPDPADRNRLASKRQEAKSQFESADSMVRSREAHQRDMELRAPCDGVVMSSPNIDEIGKNYERGTPFCTVGNPKTLRVLLPVSPADYRLLDGDLKEVKKTGGNLPVTIRVHGQADRTWQGRVTYLPESEAKEIPVQLTNKLGGNVAVKPSSKPGNYVPQSQQYLIGIEIVDPDNTICPGTMANVKVHCRWRTAAWLSWRWFNALFDLGLDWTDFLPGPLRPSS